MQDCAPPMELEVRPPTHESGAVPVLKPAMFSPVPTLQAWRVRSMDAIQTGLSGAGLAA
jgi:hypothetical protein